MLNEQMPEIVKLSARRGGVYHSFYLRYAVYREAGPLCMLAYHLLAFGNMNAIDLILGYKGFNPYVGFVQTSHHLVGSSGQHLQFFRCKIACTGQLSFDDKFFHLL